MACYTVDRIQELLEGKPSIQEKLYAKGFLITDDRLSITGEYPFYRNWSEKRVGRFSFYAHRETQLTICDKGGTFFFIIGHSVDPFDHLAEETEILEKLSSAYDRGLDEYFSAQNDLTGVFCTGFIQNDDLYFSGDCAGMQLVYYGMVKGKRYVSSHSKLVADLIGLRQDEYIERLVNSRFYHYMGTWLPGDLSPYSELCRLVPNHYVCMRHYGTDAPVRFFPNEEIKENEANDAFDETIRWLSGVIHETLSLYSIKWSHHKVAISVTGGRDSTTTLACANGLYEKFKYFSYISNESEKVDAIAAREICRNLGLEHETYEIPMSDSELQDIDAFAAVLECNAGCIGRSNPNDVRKRLFFIRNPKYDVEVKSWVNEIGRASQYVKYNKNSFPARPVASLCRSMHKIYISPRLIHQTDNVFRDYLNKYLKPEVQAKAPWLETFWWEFCWGGGEGLFLTAEHRTSSEIAIPYNNRRYLCRMLTVPLEKRKEDEIPKGIIMNMNPQIANMGIVVKNVKHTDKRALLMRLYLEVFSRIRF